MQNLEHSDGNDNDMGQKTTDAMVQNQHDCMVVRVCQKNICRSTAECTVRISWKLEQEFSGAFFLTHRNAVITAVKRTSRTSECDGREKEMILKEDLERDVKLCLHDSFCRNRETNVDPLPYSEERLEEQKCWRTASNSVRIGTDVLQDRETESAESMSQ